MKRYCFLVALHQGVAILLTNERSEGPWVRYHTAMDHIEALRAEIEALRAENAKTKGLLEDWYNDSDIPDKNCSCHINPPCNDCITWSVLRETASETKKLLGVK